MHLPEPSSSSGWPKPRTSVPVWVAVVVLVTIASPLCVTRAWASTEGDSVARYTARVTWAGGESCLAPISSCNASGMTPWPEGWAASSPSYGGGDWHEGTKTFANPLPAHSLISWVEVDLYGRFRCESNDTENVITVLLHEEVIAAMNFQTTTDGCDGCLRCGRKVRATSPLYSHGLPGYDYGPQANNTLHIRANSGVIVLNAADIHLYAQISTANDDDTTIDLAEWQLILILVAAFVGVVILISAICFGILLLLKWRERRNRNYYTTIAEGKVIRHTSTHDKGRQDVIINLTQSGEILASTENTSLLSGSFDKAKETRGDVEYQGSWRKGSGKDWLKQIQVSEIKILGRIGRGSYGDVFKGVWRGTVVAVKKLPVYFIELREEESAAFLENFQREADIMRSLHHPNILQLLSTYMEPPDLCLVMEYMPKGSLYQLLHNQSVQLNWPIIRKILLGAAKGMAYLHGCEPIVIHRDLKSHNLLIDNNWHCKVCDFGLSKILTDRPTTAKMTSCGTPSWTAPEVLRNESYTERADIFGFGVIIWECLSREDPHAGMPPFQVVLEVGSRHLRPKIPNGAPRALRELIEQCWSEDPAQRPSFQEIVTILSEMKVDVVLYPDQSPDGRPDSQILEHGEARPDPVESHWWEDEIGGPVVQSPGFEPRRTVMRNGHMFPYE